LRRFSPYTGVTQFRILQDIDVRKMLPSWTNLCRFVAKEDGQIHLGEVDANRWPDLGLSIYNGEQVDVKLVTGSIFDGSVTDTVMTISTVSQGVRNEYADPSKTDSSYVQLLSPIDISEVPIIRCLGLNYYEAAKEAKAPIPEVPVLFVRPRTALNGPYPAKINIPKLAQDSTSDYEAELSFVLSKTGRDIPAEAAMDYVLGYTCSNDVSARTQQFKNSQWSFSKGIVNSLTALVYSHGL
jgi:2-keto-4-pentenoate hydratase/2-oxohepta-3-ene-1,7-dioic acid hydratase in catechol pathway